MSVSRIFGHLREIGLEAVERGVGGFTFDPVMYAELSRAGFTVRDELEAFCWLSGSTYSARETLIGPCVRVRIPEGVFWEYWLERFGEGYTRR